MANASMYRFNPRNTGLYEAQLWKAYYERHWPRALMLLFRVLRSQFHLSTLQALQAAFWGIRAAQAWAPRTHDPKRVRAHLTRFYQVVHDATGSSFMPDKASTAELHYWTVHRELDGQEGAPELANALANIAVAVYDLPLEQAYPSGAARAHACELVDAITDGRYASTPEAWAAVTESLRRAYSLLRDAIGRQRADYTG